MQHSELNQFLSKTTSPEFSDSIINAAEELSARNVYSHEVGIENALGALEISGISATITMIESVISTTLLDELYTMGITIREASIEQLTAIFSAAHNVDNYGDPISILAICNGHITPEEKLSEVFSLLTPYHAEELIELFGDIPQSVINRTIEIVEEQVGEEDSDEREIEFIRERLKHYRNTNPNLHVFTLIRDSVSLGNAPDDYIEISREFLESLTPTALPKEIVGLLYASSAPTPTIVALAEDILPEFIAEDNKLLTAQRSLRSLIG